MDFLIVLGGAMGGALGLAVVVALAVRLLAGRYAWLARLRHRARLPFRGLLVAVAVWVAMANALPVGRDDTVWTVVETAIRSVTILLVAWLVAALILFAEDAGMQRFTTEVPNNRARRRLRTQMLILRRLTMLVVAVLAFGLVLVNFPGAGALGASVLASAGLVSVVTALAAQSTLANIIAGIQIAFSDSVRYDDAVIVEDEWGWIEELTLTYVVVRLWDERRLVLPSTYFTTTPFQNWTRQGSALMGSVEFDLDWSVDFDGMRAEIARIMPETDLWDGRVAHFQVIDAVNGWVRIRVLVTGYDAPGLYDLRCYVREHLIDWLRREHPEALPRVRVDDVRNARG